MLFWVHRVDAHRCHSQKQWLNILRTSVWFCVYFYFWLSIRKYFALHSLSCWGTFFTVTSWIVLCVPENSDVSGSVLENFWVIIILFVLICYSHLKYCCTHLGKHAHIRLVPWSCSCGNSVNGPWLYWACTRAIFTALPASVPFLPHLCCQATWLLPYTFQMSYALQWSAATSVASLCCLFVCVLCMYALRCAHVDVKSKTCSESHADFHKSC